MAVMLLFWVLKVSINEIGLVWSGFMLILMSTVLEVERLVLMRPGS